MVSMVVLFVLLWSGARDASAVKDAFVRHYYNKIKTANSRISNPWPRPRSDTSPTHPEEEPLMGSKLIGADIGLDIHLSKYWEKDFKEVGHLYGKTSDKDLYGLNLPPAVIYNSATTKRNDIIIDHTGNYEVSGFEQPGSTYPYYKYKNQLNNKQLKPEQSINYFSYSESNAIKQNTEQTNKLNTPQRENQNIDLSAKINLQGFKPYFAGNEQNIQNILSTERNVIGTERNVIRAGEVITEDNRIYRNKARNKVRQYNGNTINSRTKCPPRICRKKSKTFKRITSRPVKKFKRIVVY